LITLLAIPGLYIGVILKSMIVEDYILRIIFGVGLFPIALLMLLTKRKPNGRDSECDVTEYNIASNNLPRMIIAGCGCFVAGITGALLGLGGGVIIVPVLCIILGMPMLVAAATSVFSMIFISIAGTVLNLAIIPQIGDLSVFLFFTIAFAIGNIFGGKIGAGYACKVDGVLLRRLFGAILVFPLVHLMDIGRLWLNPPGTNLLLCTTGDIILWILIVLPCAIVWIYWSKTKQLTKQSHDIVIVEAKGS
ncbi:sulfite exporter TauE/SafE family protein, partial [Candidatus Thorarchaeota archaeon]